MRDGIDKILPLLLKVMELPGLESWNRFWDFSRISMGLEPRRKTCPKTERFWGTGRVVLCEAAGRALCEFWGRAPQARSMPPKRYASKS